MAVAALNKQALGHTSANDELLLLLTDLATFYGICSTTRLHLSPFGCLTSHVFSPPLSWLPTTTPMRALVVLMKNYLKWWAIQLVTH